MDVVSAGRCISEVFVFDDREVLLRLLEGCKKGVDLEGGIFLLIVFKEGRLDHN